ncbi:MAG: ETC complex I subunit [Parvibaculaceae bacterium]
MLARIYKPAKTAMQSGKAKTRKWILEFEAEQARSIDPLMGYTSSGDMTSQVKMKFDTKEQAVAYAEKHGIAYQVAEPKKHKPSIKAYSDNFKFGRIGQWTH